MTIKAINTVYAGYRFRSRLEARWAVFFDALRLDWEYEPEGFELESGARYLPDFRVKTPQGLDVWYEVKPRDVLDDVKFSEFRRTVDARSSMLSGDPVDHLARASTYNTGMVRKACICPRCGRIEIPAYGQDVFGTEYAVGCEPCDFETPGGGDNDSEVGVLGTRVWPYKGWIMCEVHAGQRLEHTVSSAAIRARQARFEHGEVPA